jgi:hypothetical protein
MVDTPFLHPFQFGGLACKTLMHDHV